MNLRKIGKKLGLQGKMAERLVQDNPDSAKDLLALRTWVAERSRLKAAAALTRSSTLRHEHTGSAAPTHPA